LRKAESGGGGVRVLVAAASAVRRSGLEAILREAQGLRLVGSITTLAALGRQFRELQPEVVVADLERVNVQFLNDARALPPAAVVVLLHEPDAGWSARALRAGVRAILERDAAPEEIVAAIQAAHLGLVLLDPELSREFVERLRSEPGDLPAPVQGELTPREIEVLRLLAEGHGNKEIAGRLGVTDHTIKFHISSILGKLGAATRTEAVTVGVRMGLIVL
jgi:two-component system, NarL family, response regulator YdfI